MLPCSSYLYTTGFTISDIYVSNSSCQKTKTSKKLDFTEMLLLIFLEDLCYVTVRIGSVLTVCSVS